MQPDRFAREKLAILECDTTRSRRLMRHSFGGLDVRAMLARKRRMMP
jgi:hypothetical protein